MEVTEIISFDLCGKFAHFRKFYSTSSALSYSIPPKTTLQGLVAAILGLERDSYYELFDHWYFGIQIINKHRKIFQKFNFLKIEKIKFDLDKEYSEVNGFDKRTQTSFETIIPENIRKQVLCFRIYIGVANTTDSNYKKLKEYLARGYSEYGVVLGTANMQGYTDNFIGSYEYEPIKANTDILLHSACIGDHITLSGNNENVSVEQDTFPQKMKLTSSKETFSTRIADKTASLVYPLDGAGMLVNVKENAQSFFMLKYENHSFNIALL